MTEPLVCCVMLVNGRPEMTRRAVESFRAQSYWNKRLYVYDTGEIPCTDSLPDGFPDFNIVYHRGLNKGESIGALRNLANWWGCRGSSTAPPDADIICHWDSDDLSHPHRIAEQVSLLVSSGADCVGYREAAFWDSRLAVLKRKAQAFVRGEGPCIDMSSQPPGEAWIYRSHDTAYAIGASLAYWRRTWERVKFVDRPYAKGAEDRDFIARVNCVGVSALAIRIESPKPSFSSDASYIEDCEPRLICGIHGTNTADYSKFSTQSWRRAPNLDEYCRQRMSMEPK